MLQIKPLDQHNIQKTVKTYLPSKVTDIETIQQYLSYFQTLFKDVGMPYVIVVLDVGAAMKALRTVWNYPKEYKKHYHLLGKLSLSQGKFQRKSFCLNGDESISFVVKSCFLGCISTLT